MPLFILNSCRFTLSTLSIAFCYYPDGKLKPPKAYKNYSSLVTNDAQLALSTNKSGSFSQRRVTMLKRTADKVLICDSTFPPKT